MTTRHSESWFVSCAASGRVTPFSAANSAIGIKVKQAIQAKNFKIKTVTTADYEKKLIELVERKKKNQTSARENFAKRV